MKHFVYRPKCGMNPVQVTGSKLANHFARGIVYYGYPEMVHGTILVIHRACLDGPCCFISAEGLHGLRDLTGYRSQQIQIHRTVVPLFWSTQMPHNQVCRTAQLSTVSSKRFLAAGAI